MRSISLAIGLLLMALFVPAAGAIYVPGQVIPDDGLMHIMSAENNGMATAPVQMPGGISLSPFIPYAGNAGPIVMPTAPDLNHLADQFSQGPMPMVPETWSSPPCIPGTPGTSIIPVVNLPAADAAGNIVMGDVIGHMVPPSPPGYWDNIQDKDLHTNMPMIKGPAIIGL